jgi:hypothetical protein
VAEIQLGDKAAPNFSKIVNDFGAFVQAADPAKEDKRIGNKDLLLADTSTISSPGWLAKEAMLEWKSMSSKSAC